MSAMSPAKKGQFGELKARLREAERAELETLATLDEALELLRAWLAGHAPRTETQSLLDKES